MEPKADNEFFAALERHKILTHSINKRNESKISRNNESKYTNKDSQISRSRGHYESFMKNKKPKSQKKYRTKTREDRGKSSNPQSKSSFGVINRVHPGYQQI